MIVRVHYPDPFSGGFRRIEYEAERCPEPGALRRTRISHPAEGARAEIVEITHVADGVDGVETVGIVRLDALGDLRILAVGGLWNYLPVVPDIHRPALIDILRRLFHAIPDLGEAAAGDVQARLDGIGESFRPIGEQLPTVGPRIKDLVTIIKGRGHLAALTGVFGTAPAGTPAAEVMP